MKKRYKILGIIALLFSFIFINNNFVFVKSNKTMPRLMAHRGLAQTFDISAVKWDTNTAEIIYPPDHHFIENTIPSMQAAFDYGASIVEFDIRVTKDKQLAVFHDYIVEYRTECSGEISAYTLAELQKMDIGYRYTHDGGKTFPLRNTGVGLLPSFDEVLEAFPRGEFLVHIRDGGIEIGELLLEKLQKLNDDEIQRISIYGNDEAITLIKMEFPEMKALSAKLLKRALIEYVFVGWTGYMPKSTRNLEIHIPISYAKILWGWPEKFVERMENVGSRVVLITKQGQWSGGFDTENEIKKIPDNYYGFIWTERVDKISQYFKTR